MTYSKALYGVLWWSGQFEQMWGFVSCCWSHLCRNAIWKADMFMWADSAPCDQHVTRAICLHSYLLCYLHKITANNLFTHTCQPWSLLYGIAEQFYLQIPLLEKFKHEDLTCFTAWNSSTNKISISIVILRLFVHTAVITGPRQT